MKHIKIFLYILVVLISCTSDEEKSSLPPFVRFSLLVDTNGNILEYPSVLPNIIERDFFEQVTLKTIKIPVVVSALPSSQSISINFEHQINSSFNGYSVEPSNGIIQLNPNRLVDTIYVSFQNAWDENEQHQLKFKIKGISDPKIQIGWPNNHNKMDEVTIKLGDLTKIRFNFQQNLYNLQGNLNETLLIPIQFNQPVTNTLLQNTDLFDVSFQAISNCDGDGVDFDYSLTRLPFQDGSQIVFYEFKLLEQTPFASNLKLVLKNNISNLQPFGITQTNIQKAPFVNRIGDVAVNWYNASDPLYRTFGKAWYYDPVDLTCKWSTFNAFTKPVTTAAGSEFDNGFGYHKYQIGFVGNNPPIGTNPFDFRRYYANASVSSPGFNLIRAIEFFPQNGNSTTGGTVKVVPQVISLIRLSNNQTVNIPICGSGYYFFNAIINRWEMYIEVHCDETSINGNNNVVRPMYIYSNNNDNSNPANLSISCPVRINL